MAVLAVGINCGNFSLERLFPSMTAAPEQLTDIRYMCIPAILAFLFLRRRESARPQGAEPLWALGLLGIFLLYGFVRTGFSSGFAVAFAPLEEYALTLFYGVFAWLSFRTMRDVDDFLMITLAIVLAVLGVYIADEMIAGSLDLATDYYYSRMFFIGFLMALFTLFRHMDTQKRGIILWLIGLMAVIFLLAGLSTVMRAAGLFYVLSLSSYGVLLAALHRYGRIAIIALMAVTAYGAVYLHSTNIIHYKQQAYSPYVQAPAPAQISKTIDVPVDASPKTDTESAVVPGVTVPGEEKCDEDIQIYISSTGRQVTKSEYSCSENISIRDADARVRMVLLALKEVRSPLFGNGLGTFRFVDMAGSNGRPVQFYTYPHNIYVQFYNETGVVGLAIVALSIFFILGFCLRVILTSENPSTVGVLCLIPLFFLMSGAVAGDFFDIRFVWTTPFLIAALMPAGARESVA